ncbi:M23 family metallopeptidase [Dysgonomonas sp. 520]|uniref:M23 family metallopeptidase n=1 Tax=Dysgonomonas sp. 520 TaxID=2302931 RepID=UPI0013D5E8A4|nr:M23 family metallopeptidase [Dysgonomonas sp. 520]NDW10700.1 M23 family peptidase [Dysgonomonas sp. 520]
MKRLYIGGLLFFTFWNVVFSQSYRNPMDFPMILSANFGELRSNHFHSGIDIKTQMAENKRVHAIEDGYVSRIVVSPSGYGLALYIDHPKTGHTSLYGHLNSFAPQIAKYVKEKQYESESYRVDLTLEKDAIPLKKGDFIAYSGNTGGSLGPHVHFEIRDTESGRVLDPLVYYKSQITDTTKPEFRGIAVYPISGKGVVNGSSSPVRQNITKNKKGEIQGLKTTMEAWGKIGVGVKAYDRMTGTTNVYGVRNVRLLLDGNEIFNSTIDGYSFDQTRMINTFADYDAWIKSKDWYMKSFIEDGNKLPFYNSTNGSYIEVNQERIYKLKYELTDLYGNVATYEFSITGKKQNIPTEPACSLYMPWDRDNRYISDTFSLIIEKGNLYNDCCFSLKRIPSQQYLSDVYQVNNNAVPLDKKAEMKIKLNIDTLNQKSQYGIVRVRNGSKSWIGGVYEDGFLIGSIRELGSSYAVYYDNTPPAIEPVQPIGWVKQKNIKIRLSDNLSGIKSVKGTIDGDYILLTNDVKSPVYSYAFDDEKLQKGQNHQLKIIVYDRCDNMSEYTYEFYY